jgi:hypothetical protein
MNAFTGALIFLTAFLVGCGATRDVAVTSYHVTRGVAVGSYRVATAPVHYALKRHRDDSSITTETTSSDVSAPGYPTSAPEVATTQPQPAKERVSRVSRDETAQTKPRRSPAPRTSSARLDFPTAKAVPDKPGYVVSPFDASGRYVDVSGYASGSKVKDPWTDKIFIVP